MKTITNKPRVNINDWCIQFLPNYHNEPYRLYGKARNHPRFDPDTCIRTSTIIGMDIPNKIIETMNTIYILGDPNKSFIDNLHNAGFTLSDYPVVEIDYSHFKEA